MHYIRIGHGYSERRACQVIQFNRCSARRPPSEDRDLLLRARMLELAEDRRRFGFSRLHELLRREGLVQRRKPFATYPQTSEASKPCKHCPGWPCGPDEQWAMDFVSAALMDGRRIRILTIADIWDRSSPALEVDMSLPGVRVVRVFEKLRLQGRLPQRIKVDNDPEFSGMQRWSPLVGQEVAVS